MAHSLSKALSQVIKLLLQVDVFVVADCDHKSFGLLLKWMGIEVARLQEHRRNRSFQRLNGDDCEKLKNKRSHDDDLEMRASTFN
jgi:hypothetical protein